MISTQQDYTSHPSINTARIARITLLLIDSTMVYSRGAGPPISNSDIPLDHAGRTAYMNYQPGPLWHRVLANPHSPSSPSSSSEPHMDVPAWLPIHIRGSISSPASPSTSTSTTYASNHVARGIKRRWERDDSPSSYTESVMSAATRDGSDSTGNNGGMFLDLDSGSSSGCETDEISSGTAPADTMAIDQTVSMHTHSSPCEIQKKQARTAMNRHNGNGSRHDYLGRVLATVEDSVKRIRMSTPDEVGQEIVRRWGMEQAPPASKSPLSSAPGLHEASTHPSRDSAPHFASHANQSMMESPAFHNTAFPPPNAAVASNMHHPALRPIRISTRTNSMSSLPSDDTHGRPAVHGRNDNSGAPHPSYDRGQANSPYISMNARLRNVFLDASSKRKPAAFPFPTLEPYHLASGTANADCGHHPNPQGCWPKLRKCGG
ncbi:hypothetical protein SeMB42_g04650 [Synchytrium endobioticum]|uniref:Uncharacterized protein n=1 Tax=Synchytrium endobioticum TaxID=286115 RepID=A0A507CWZ3_9FUNG|nr:hypothetical protein SeMB42_g04650 [Synchytrium endobioticum]